MRLLGTRIIGYAAVAAGALRVSELPEDIARLLPRYPAPVLHLARLAVDRRAQNAGIGTELLSTTVDIALEMRARVGCVGILVDSKPESVAFYEARGFRRLSVVSRIAGAGAPPVRLFCDLRHLGDAALLAAGPPDEGRVLAAEVRRRARELGLSPEELRRVADLLGQQ